MKFTYRFGYIAWLVSPAACFATACTMLVLSAKPMRAAAFPTPVYEQMSTPGPARISGGVMASMAVTKVAPVYPAEAKAAGVSGAVVLHALIARDGTVENLEVVSGPPELRDAALDAVKQWTYKPFLLNGNPVEVDTTVTVNFSLQP